MNHVILTPAEDLHVQQMELEQGMTEQGIARYRSRVEKNQKRGTEADTAYGSSIIARCTETVADAIQALVTEANTGKAGRRHVAVKYLQQIDARTAAYLTLKGILNSITKVTPVQRVALTIGSLIEDEIRFRGLREEDAKLYKRLVKMAAERNAYRNKRIVITHTTNYLGIEWDAWPVKDKEHLGLKLIDLVITTIGLVELTSQSHGTSKTMLYLTPTEETRRWIADRNAAAELMSPIYEPMIVAPREWSSPFNGGYLTRYVRPIKLVKTRNKNYLEELANTDMPVVYAAINAMQNTAWQVNQRVLDVMVSLWDNSSTLAGIPSKYDLPLPNKPLDIDDNAEARKAWRIAAAKVHMENRELTSKRTQFVYCLNTATKYSRFEELFFPYQMDFRGRCYAVPMLNPQGPDFMKGLLRFAKGKALGTEGAKFLAIHLANCGDFGKVSKQSFEARIQWVLDNEARIVSVATDPLADLWWTEADSPFCFLAAAMEWAGFLTEGESFVSHIPVALDGSCSGIQHFSLALRDEVGGKAVNLIPTEKPQDIYQLVADKVNEQLQADLDSEETMTLKVLDEIRKVRISELALAWRQFGVDRSVCKRPTMTYGYGSREFGFRDQIMVDTLRPAQRAAASGNGIFPFEADGFSSSLYMAKLIARAVDQTVVKAAEAMQWLKGAATLVASEGLPVRWNTPDAFPVLQEYLDTSSKRVETVIAGKRTVLTLTEDLPSVDKRKQASGISPNFVHALDGCHLRLTVVRAMEEGMDSFALVHDSFGVHAADTPRFFQIIREAMVEIYQTCDVIEDFRSELLEQLSPKNREKLAEAPARGSLELEAVLASDYCFA